jgi:hypothetical protein
MNAIKYLVSAIALLVMLSGSVCAQTHARTVDGDVVVFNKETSSWVYADKSKASDNKAASISTERLKSVLTKKGEISIAELKSIYFSQAPDDEVVKIVDEIYADKRNCSCIACQWPSHCTWGDDCRYRRNIPCNWCCN